MTQYAVVLHVGISTTQSKIARRTVGKGNGGSLVMEGRHNGQ